MGLLPATKRELDARGTPFVHPAFTPCKAPTLSLKAPSLPLNVTHLLSLPFRSFLR